MLRHFATCVAVTLAIAVATVATWRILEENHAEQRARIVASESHAARSQLVHTVDLMLDTLRNLHRYWSEYARLPRDQWVADAGIELARFKGIELILWSDAESGVHYARTPDHPVFDYEPGPAELERAGALLERGADVRSEAILGPFTDAEGNPSYEVHIVDGRGALVAVIDTRKSLTAMLRNVSPGYSIDVLWGDTLLYRRGKPAIRIAADMRRAGMIRTSTGTLWKVVHTPTAEFAASISTPALPGVLVAGLAIAALVGLLLWENRRAQSRAQAAEIAETKLAELNRNLEREITERTRELADRSADLGTITDSVAHDLRNPLNSISVNTQLLEQQYGDILGEDGLTALERTSAGVKRMTEILDRLLGLSVVSHTTFRRERVDLGEMVRDIFEELSASEPPPPVELVTGDLPDADADPTLIRTLVLNLVSNALKYTRGRKHRHVEVGCETQDGVPVYFVRDNGIGFDGDSAERLFRAFERLGRDGDAEEGIGLGLNIAVRVVRRHDGRIWAESRLGQGAAFYFTLQPPPSGRAVAARA